MDVTKAVYNRARRKVSGAEKENKKETMARMDGSYGRVATRLSGVRVLLFCSSMARRVKSRQALGFCGTVKSRVNPREVFVK